MSIKNLKNNDIYNSLQKNKKNLIKISLLFVLLGVSINAFAWLSSNNTATVDAEADVSSWIVRFTDKNNVDIKEETYALWMLPGMQDDVYPVHASNEGTTDAKVTVEVTDLNILGAAVDLNEADVLKKFPFEFQLPTGEIDLDAGDETDFNTTISWTYEDEQYFKNDDYYGGFQPDFVYYTKNGDDYEETEVTASTYETLKNSLYIYKDDIDTFFGQECGEYQNSTGKACITFRVKYIATQVQP